MDASHESLIMLSVRTRLWLDVELQLLSYYCKVDTDPRALEKVRGSWYYGSMACIASPIAYDFSHQLLCYCGTHFITEISEATG